MEFFIRGKSRSRVFEIPQNSTKFHKSAVPPKSASIFVMREDFFNNGVIAKVVI